MGSKEITNENEEILSWNETSAMADQLRHHAVMQFINLHRAFKDRDGDGFLWGDETEYFLVKMDKANRKVYLNLRVQAILDQLQQIPRNQEKAIWKPEYGAFQIEGVPLRPYSGEVVAMLSEVESNMRMRREVLRRHLLADEAIVTLTTFPRLGCQAFTHPVTTATPAAEYGSKSIFISDEAISNGHPRFLAGANNVRERRKEKISINIPLFKDVHSSSTLVREELSDPESQLAAKEGHIYMDCMTFGCACSLQVTVQAKNLCEARRLYDHLAVMCPIILALSAASPVHRGYLSNVDCRWDVLSGAKDDRTREERALRPLQNDRFVIPKSRHDSIDYFLSPSGQKYNDVPLVYDHNVYDQLKEAGVDEVLSRHVAHLFIRDPLTLLKSKVAASDDITFTEHFENLQSTNWQSMRLKPPPFHTDIGWRVEFRTCEVQLSDYENASYALFLIFLAKAIIAMDVNLLLPLSKVEENMRVAQKVDAVVKETFWFRNDITSNIENDIEQCGYSRMSVDTIINGNQAIGFPGLIPLVTRHIKNNTPDVSSDQLQHYTKLLSARASGEIKTTARWTRDFILAHPEYKNDSVVSDEISYDLVHTLIDNPRIVQQQQTEVGFTPCLMKDQLRVDDICPLRQCQFMP